MSQLIIKINGKDFTAEFDKLNSNRVIINNKPFDIELIRNYGNKIFAFTVNSKMVQIELDINEKGTSHIIIDGFTHDIEITTATKLLLEKFLQQSAGASQYALAHIKAPMPGMIIKVMADEGAEVKKGDKLIIIEAMKMENALSSPMDGRIKTIKVREGMAVEKDSFLIELEAV